MTNPTKADLAAAVKALTEENAGLRDLLAAVHEAAEAAPFAKHWQDSDKARDRTRSMLGAISVLTDPAGTWTWGWANGRTAAGLRKYAAEPLEYEPDAEPAAAPERETAPAGAA